MITSAREPGYKIAVGCDFWVQPEERLLNRLIKSLGEKNVYLRSSLNV
jgi:hypothetical protein